jgi:hypothetical protein
VSPACKYLMILRVKSKRVYLHYLNIAVMEYLCVRFKFEFYGIRADPGGRAVKRVRLRPLACWDWGFEYRQQDGYLSL